MQTLRQFVSNPYLNMLVGVLLLYSGLSESWYQFQAMENYHIGVHHGVILFSLMHIAKTLPDIFDGLEHFTEAEEPE